MCLLFGFLMVWFIKKSLCYQCHFSKGKQSYGWIAYRQLQLTLLQFARWVLFNLVLCFEQLSLLLVCFCAFSDFCLNLIPTNHPGNVQ